MPSRRLRVAELRDRLRVVAGDLEETGRSHHRGRGRPDLEGESQRLGTTPSRLLARGEPVCHADVALSLACRPLGELGVDTVAPFEERRHLGHRRHLESHRAHA